MCAGRNKKYGESSARKLWIESSVFLFISGVCMTSKIDRCGAIEHRAKRGKDLSAPVEIDGGFAEQSIFVWGEPSVHATELNEAAHG